MASAQQPGLAVPSPAQQPAQTTMPYPAQGFDVHGMGIVKIYQLMESEVRSLGSASAAENITMSGCFACLGGFISAVLGYLALPDPKVPADAHPVVVGTYVGALIALGVLTVVCGALWFVFWRARAKAVAEIIRRSPVPVRFAFPAHSAGTPQQAGTAP
jgi:hypothetical protein